jgi:hypothetical protein
MCTDPKRGFPHPPRVEIQNKMLNRNVTGMSLQG